MTLNGVMAFILRYFTWFGSFRGTLCKQTKYKYSITASLNFLNRFMNLIQDLKAQYLPNYRLVW